MADRSKIRNMNLVKLSEAELKQLIDVGVKKAIAELQPSLIDRAFDMNHLVNRARSDSEALLQADRERECLLGLGIASSRRESLYWEWQLANEQLRLAQEGK